MSLVTGLLVGGPAGGKYYALESSKSGPVGSLTLTSFAGISEEGEVLVYEHVYRRRESVNVSGLWEYHYVN